MKIVHKRAFYWSVGLSLVLIFAYIFRNPNMTSFNRGNASPVRNIYDLLMYLVPLFTVVIYGVFPESNIGKIGGWLYRLVVYLLSVR